MTGGPQMHGQMQHYPPQAKAMPPQAAPPTYNAGPNLPPDGRRILHVYHQGWTRRHTQVLDSDKVTPIYNIDSNSASMFSSKPHMTITNAITGVVVGTVSFHQISSSIDIEVHGRPISFDKRGTFSSSHSFQSIATGHTYKWKKDGTFSGVDLRCVDETQQIVATFECSNWAMKKDGKFEIAPLVDGPFFDEVMITGIAAMEFQRRQKSSAASGGGGG